MIYESQTACYPQCRRAAIRKLGNRYNCICNPEIMTAFVYALNDADYRVRREAADEIGDQVRRHCCCCPEVVTALTCALGDCDRGVVRQAEQALRLCGYDVVNGCCDSGCTTACNTGCTNGCAPGAAAPAMMPATEPAAPAPVPPEEKKASRQGGLSRLLGMLD
ncbi:MAG: HEAT repeat domain-containing protein [Planctomycetota bacterium]